MRNEDDFLRSKGLQSPDDYNGALGTEEVGRDSLEALVDKIREMEVTGRVSKTDVEPYLQHFPPHIGLDDFDDTPSERGFPMALESMAAFMRMGLALAVMGAVGYVVFNLITSREKAKQVTSRDGWRAYLFASIDKVRGYLVNSPLVQNEQMVGPDGLNLRNAIAAYLKDNSTVAVGLEKQGAGLFAKTWYGAYPAFGSRVPLDQHIEQLSQLKPLTEIRKLLDRAGDRIQAGDGEGLVEEIKKMMEESTPRRFAEELMALYKDVIKPPTADVHVGRYLFGAAEMLQGYYEGIVDNEVNYDNIIAKQIQDLGVGHTPLPATSNKLTGDIGRIEAAIREGVRESERLKNEARTYKLSADVELPTGEALEAIKMITGAAAGFIDLVLEEVTSAYHHALWLGHVHVDILEMAETIMKHNGESAKANKLADMRKDLVRTLKKAS